MVKKLAPFALAVHHLVNKLPTTMRTKNSTGVRIEDGEIIDYDYTGPILEKVLENGKNIQGNLQKMDHIKEYQLLLYH